MLNNKCYILLLCFIPGISTSLFAQKPVYINHFKPNNQYETTSGIAGTALNLSASAKFRKVIKVKNELNNFNGDFSVLVWVKASENCDSSYEILSTITPNSYIKSGWTIGMHANGAWYWIAQGNNYYYYEEPIYKYYPTAQRQTVKDGDWHLLAFTYSKEKKVVRLYYDGLNTATYFVPHLDILNRDSLYIGGRSQKIYHNHVFEEWSVFNGYLDELELFNQILAPSYIEKIYTKFFPTKSEQTTQLNSDTFKVMTFNIMNGGNVTGKEVGVERVVDVIKLSGADIITMQETYGSGSKIADKLGYYYYFLSRNLSIMSRYPFEEVLKGQNPWNNGGVYVKLNEGNKIAVFTNWFLYSDKWHYWSMIEKHEPIDHDAFIKGLKHGPTFNCASRIINKLQPYIKNADSIPVVFCGDLNSGSYLDWTKATSHLNAGLVIPFPTSKLLHEVGFHDSFRELHPDPLKERGITWSPMYPNDFKDRIDFIYYKGENLKAIKSEVISTHTVRFPSDHAAVLTTFKLSGK